MYCEIYGSLQIAVWFLGRWETQSSWKWHCLKLCDNFFKYSNLLVKLIVLRKANSNMGILQIWWNGLLWVLYVQSLCRKQSLFYLCKSCKINNIWSLSFSSILHLPVITLVFIFLRMNCKIAPESLQLYVASEKEVLLGLAGNSCLSLATSNCVHKSVKLTDLTECLFSPFLMSSFSIRSVSCSTSFFDCTVIRFEINE